jgi:hypothetical protein
VDPILRIGEKTGHNTVMHVFIYRARINVLDAEIKKRQFERYGYTFVGELSPEEAKLPDLKMHETVLVFSHPMR